MNIGKMRERAKILQIEKDGAGNFSWQQCGQAWAYRERLREQNIFSRNAVSAPSFAFTIRKCKLTLHNALELGGKFYFLTDISPEKAGFLKITAAAVSVTVCKTFKQEQKLSENNTPIVMKTEGFSFPACLAEKYNGFRQDMPMSTLEYTRIMVAPKAVKLDSGDLVQADGAVYNVGIVHSLDEFNTEYEIRLKEDA